MLVVTGSGAGGVAGLESQKDWWSEERAGVWILVVLAFSCEGGGGMTGEEGGENESQRGWSRGTLEMTQWRQREVIPPQRGLPIFRHRIETAYPDIVASQRPWQPEQQLASRQSVPPISLEGRQIVCLPFVIGLAILRSPPIGEEMGAGG